MHVRSVLLGLAVLFAATGLVLGGCGDDDDADANGFGGEPTQVVSDSGGVSNSSVAPNTFLTLDGDRFQLESLEQASLAPAEGEYKEVGTASEADIDQPDLTVYRRDGETEAVYTYAAAKGEGEEATPPFWYRWVPEP